MLTLGNHMTNISVGQSLFRYGGRMNYTPDLIRAIATILVENGLLSRSLQAPFTGFLREGKDPEWELGENFLFHSDGCYITPMFQSETSAREVTAIIVNGKLRAACDEHEEPQRREA